MAPYIILLFFPLFFHVILKNKIIIIKNIERKVTSENIVVPIFFILFILILVCRDDSIGRDLGNYKIIFNAIGNGKLFENYYGIKEPIFQWYNWFVYNYISNNFQVFLMITAIISAWPIAKLYNKDKSHGYLKISIYVNMSTFIMLFSGIRQGLAMCFGILAFQSLVDNKNIKFLLYALMGTFTHHTGFMIFCLFPLFKIKFRKKNLLFVLPVSCIIVVFRTQLFNILTRFMSNSNEKYMSIAESTGAWGSFLLFLIFTFFCYIISNERQMDDEAFSLRNVLVFATIMQSFASLNPLAMRMNYYFILLIPIAVAKCLDYADTKYAQIAKIGELVIEVFFSVLFIYNTYSSFITGRSALDTIPYIPFWKGD